ncbi:MAG: response regulator [Anaerolineae bacterium]|jgi:CheY-like chemotaxis protein/predicted regulator of Ras-like GTPase activity (Roadblock/LC7/MglB family)
MDETRSILIVDSNVAFATMLKESLEQDTGYQVAVTPDASEALEMASQRSYDLAVVDLGITAVGELDGERVARTLRDRHPGLRLILIPLHGEELPEHLADLDVQGTMSKPFFLPDLPELLHAAMAKPLPDSPEPEADPEPSEEKARPTVPAAASAPSRECSPQVIREIETLAREVNADSVLLTREGEVLGSVGHLKPEHLETLAKIIARSSQLSHEAAKVLGGEKRHFEQSVEGRDHILYSLTVVEDVLLTVLLRPDVTLGLLRHQARATARRLQDLMVT